MMPRRRLVERLVLALPWIFLIWLIAQGMAGAIDGLLVFFLLFILIPLAIFTNLVTAVFFRGKDVFKTIKQVQQAQKSQKPLQTTNYADLPWWNPKRWFR